MERGREGDRERGRRGERERVREGGGEEEETDRDRKRWPEIDRCCVCQK